MRRFSQRNSLVTLNEINITPLLDLAFVLLIIFVITRPLLEQNVSLQLPQNMGRPDNRTIDQYRAPGWRQDPRDQRQKRALAATALADDGDELTGLNRQGNAAQCFRLLLGAEIVQYNVPQFHFR